MRIIVAGCEYSGVSTLIEAIDAWGRQRGIHHHLDDHFAIPDAYHLGADEQRAMLAMLPAIKERFQRFQIAYHVRLLHKYQHILLGGFHLEEAVYGPRFYYPGLGIEVREYEPDMPADTVLVHLYADPAVIRARMAAHPHPHQLVPAADVEDVLRCFADEYRRSLIHRRFAVDTSDLSPAQLLDAFLRLSIPHLDPGDAVARLLTR
jgi:hypothetical protein